MVRDWKQLPTIESDGKKMTQESYPRVTSFDGQNFSQITTYLYRRAFRNFELSKHITQCASFMKQTCDP